MKLYSINLFLGSMKVWIMAILSFPDNTLIRSHHQKFILVFILSLLENTVISTDCHTCSMVDLYFSSMVLFSDFNVCHQTVPFFPWLGNELYIVICTMVVETLSNIFRIRQAFYRSCKIDSISDWIWMLVTDRFKIFASWGNCDLIVRQLRSNREAIAI